MEESTDQSWHAFCAANDADTDWIYDDIIEKNNSAVPATYQYWILEVVLNLTLNLAQFSR